LPPLLLGGFGSTHEIFGLALPNRRGPGLFGTLRFEVDFPDLGERLVNARFAHTLTLEALSKVIPFRSKRVSMRRRLSKRMHVINTSVYRSHLTTITWAESPVLVVRPDREV
jgi:hypothetical protein